jgi:hypothetical protein
MHFLGPFVDVGDQLVTVVHIDLEAVEATGSHRKLDPAEGLQDAQLDNGARLHIVHGDVGRDGHVLVNIRKFTGGRHSMANPRGVVRRR